MRIQIKLSPADTREDTDTRPNYTFNWLPAAGVSVVAQVRLAYMQKDGSAGTWSDWKSFTLTGV